MGETSIAWTDYTFNPWWGCTRVSPGCQHCYAEAFSHRLGLDLWGPEAGRRFFDDKHWAEPRLWERRRLKGDPRHRVFCASMADVFEVRTDAYENAVLDNERRKLWRLIEDTPALTWQLLTKRPENWRRLVPERWTEAWPDNAWALVSVEDNERAEQRIPLLLEIPALVRGISYEPALELVDFDLWLFPELEDGRAMQSGLNWMIYGGESGAGARPNDLAWARAVRDQCRQASVAFFMKQAGAHCRMNRTDAVRACRLRWRWVGCGIARERARSRSSARQGRRPGCLARRPARSGVPRVSACGYCGGKGKTFYICSNSWIPCAGCKGDGVERRRPEWIEGGQRAREKRVAEGRSLGDEARRLGVRPVDVSDMEHGRRGPLT